MTACDYCGQKIATGVVYCPGCGTQLVELAPAPESGERQKSKASAVILALIFGPLGLLYLGMEGMMVILFVLGISVFLFPIILLPLHNNGLGLLFTLLVRVACVWWALNIIDHRNNESISDPDAETLLNQATKLENVDFDQAIAKYEEVIEKYPSTSASKVAKTCVNTLKLNKSRNTQQGQ